MSMGWGWFVGGARYGYDVYCLKNIEIHTLPETNQSHLKIDG